MMDLDPASEGQFITDPPDPDPQHWSYGTNLEEVRGPNLGPIPYPSYSTGIKN